MKSIRFCPRCESENVEMLVGIGGFTGRFRCGDCDFEGIFPIREYLPINKNKKIKKIKK